MKGGHRVINELTMKITGQNPVVNDKIRHLQGMRVLDGGGRHLGDYTFEGLRAGAASAAVDRRCPDWTG
jgi:hypothetical protein